MLRANRQVPSDCTLFGSGRPPVRIKLQRSDMGLAARNPCNAAEAHAFFRLLPVSAYLVDRQQGG
jgi:hypothetical protein